MTTANEFGTQEEIERCLSCPAEECWDCIRWGRDPDAHAYHVKKLDVDLLIRKYNAGAGVPEMCAALGIGAASLRQRLDRLGLPYVKREPRPTLDRQFFIDLPDSLKTNLKWRKPV